MRERTCSSEGARADAAAAEMSGRHGVRSSVMLYSRLVAVNLSRRAAMSDTPLGLASRAPPGFGATTLHPSADSDVFL